MVDVANEVGADGVAHGCTAKGNDQACLGTMSIDLYVPFVFILLTQVLYYM